MSFLQKAISFAAVFASLGGAYAKLDLSSTSNVAMYWGQNSFKGQGKLAQQPLAFYCNDDKIDVIQLAFLMNINGLGGAPEYDFQNASDHCNVFEGTNLKNCPQVGADIATCQKKNKTIILSIGGATYSEGGFRSEADAIAGADKVWQTFGPPSTNTSALRPFGNSSVDGFDFDFEANVFHMGPFAKRLRELGDADKTKPFFLTAAPQCMYPDLADKDILNGSVAIDAAFVQFYNNWCGVNSFTPGKDIQTSFNFIDWDNWAKNVSKNGNTKVFLGVPANTGAASTGYLPADKLEPVIKYSKTFKSFGGVMMWDVSQAYANEGFLDSAKKALGKVPSRILRPASGSQPNAWYWG
ncbi:hypothetical protein ASPWEDRAFT_601856 [Aspergillus wentii DTO 134E9]|uniref:chitinase n=1 Tax=Aspergillus wentii DTO 134E9 TaxID=1073089 RepID=A0A1L9RDL2_ASPWE|nr:uncharacterized protein ASPWEDRAFT_601856 [Aspergillus wentii DTO 134E9]KAI9933283.1 hypothetical protein MW887_007756 [Aspergillus wentii]OJJ33012.1 hypothetical protein ASPWEDRAFT_601856 [Aspergillus wentii DTO 134E9]